MRRTWHGMNQPKPKPKPKLPSYFRTTKRLKGLDEFEPPQWKGRLKFGDNRALKLSPATWFNILLLAAIVGVFAGWWLAPADRCAIVGEFKIGWC